MWIKVLSLELLKKYSNVNLFGFLAAMKCFDEMGMAHALRLS